jgi:glycosyltransferase involved in cell wall biosynthesis
MKVAVIVPTYNEEKYIGKCIEALLNQDTAADEIIIVDNNSSDNTIGIVQKYPVTLLKEKTQGITPARNTGFNASHCDILARCDADTIVFPDWIEKIKKNFETKPIIGLTGPAYFYDLPFRPVLQRIHTFFYFKMFEHMLKHGNMFGSNMAITKDGWEKVKNQICLDDHKVHEDMDLSHHLSFYGKIIFDPKLLVSISGRRITQHPSSLFEYPYRGMKSIREHKS